MNNLASQGVVEVYPPLMDVAGSYSAQFEHVSLSCIPDGSYTPNAI